MPTDVAAVPPTAAATIFALPISSTVEVFSAGPSIQTLGPARAAVQVLGSSGSVVEVIQQGPQGPPGASGNAATDAEVTTAVTAAVAATAHITVQTVPAGNWIIPHPLGRVPVTTVYDTDGHLVFPDVYATDTTVTFVFAVPTAGTALLT